MLSWYIMLYEICSTIAMVFRVILSRRHMLHKDRNLSSFINSLTVTTVCIFSLQTIKYIRYFVSFLLAKVMTVRKQKAHRENKPPRHKFWGARNNLARCGRAYQVTIVPCANYPELFMKNPFIRFSVILLTDPVSPAAPKTANTFPR